VKYSDIDIRRKGRYCIVESFILQRLIIFILKIIFFVFFSYICCKPYLLLIKTSGKILYTIKKPLKKMIWEMFFSLASFILMINYIKIISVKALEWYLYPVAIYIIIGWLLPQLICVNGIIHPHKFIKWNEIDMVRLYEGYAVIHIETRRTLNNNFTFYCEKNSVNELIRILEDKKVKIIKEENR
jgi:hypothetical protein